MLDRLSTVIGAVLAITGLAMIACLDIPAIQQGGLNAPLAALDLVAATLVVCALLGLASREW